MCLCDELLTIVVLGLVNRFVHGRVPTAVSSAHMVGAILPSSFISPYEKGLHKKYHIIMH